MCFSIPWIEHLLIMLVIIGACVAFVRLVLPNILGALGAAGGVVAGAINIILWAVVIIFVIILFFDLIQCAGGLSLRG
jgi:hypothetical protein